MSWEPLPAPLDEFVFFLAYAMRELGLAEEPTKQQCAVADWMQGGPDRQLTVAFRGLGKSLLASLYACWRLRMDRNERILVVSATSVKATDFTGYMLKAMAEVDLLRCLLPELGDRSSMTAFDVAGAVVEQSPSVRSMGVMGSVTGQRCSCAVLDDIETLANVVTQLKQERVAHAVTEIEAILKPDEGQLLPRQVLYLGTPHTEASIYLRLVRERGYRARYWPARYPDDLEPYAGDLCPRIRQELEEDPGLVGQPTDPERFSDEDLLKRQASTTRASFLLQYQLNTRLANLDHYPIRLGDLVVMDLDGKALPEVVVHSTQPDERIRELVCLGMGADCHYFRPGWVHGWVTQDERWSCVMAIDPAGRGRDELAWAVVAELNGNLFLLESGGTQKGYDAPVLEHLANVAKRWKVTLVKPEPNMGDGMFSALLQPYLTRIWPCTIEEPPWSSVRKEVRICDTLGPVIQQHRLVVNTDVLRRDYRETEEDPETGLLRSLAFQMSRLTNERGCLSWDDRVDALALAVAHYTDAARQDQLVEQQERADAMFQAEVEALLDEMGSGVDQLALGIAARGVFGGRAEGGVRRMPSCRPGQSVEVGGSSR